MDGPARRRDAPPASCQLCRTFYVHECVTYCPCARGLCLEGVVRDLYVAVLVFTVRCLPYSVSRIIWFPVTFYQYWRDERDEKRRRSFYA